ncbi:MAG: AAA family ATPase [Candidatus Pacebacteria bacterium]|nr:AAA family ATPase [Candidatus Paceibacterota bacterium]
MSDQTSQNQSDEQGLSVDQGSVVGQELPVDQSQPAGQSLSQNQPLSQVSQGQSANQSQLADLQNQPFQNQPFQDQPPSLAQKEQNAKPDYQAILRQEIQELKDKVAAASMPEELRAKANKDITALERSVEVGNYDEKYEKVSKYIDWILQIPWQAESEDRLDIDQAKQIFDKHHYGMQEVKNRFLEYIAVLNLRKRNYENEEFGAPVLLLVGLVGTGKTTFAYSLAEALNRPIVRIPFGGMGSAKELRGDSRLLLGSEPGMVVKGISETGVRNPVILLDEIDRVSEAANRDIMGVLVELLDPAQNHAFRDAYIDYPVNLSHAIFIATANNTTKIATAVLDRLEKIEMPSYTDQEKMVIAREYVLPQLLEQAGLKPGQFKIEEDVWPQMVRPLGYDAGIRTLQRTLQGAVRKAARIIVERGFDQVVINQDNKKIFLPSY